MTHPIKQIRRNLGLTQEDLARLAGLSSLWLAQVERGATRSFPRKLAEVLRELGYDAEQVRRESEVYVQGCRQAEMRKLKQMNGSG